VADAGYRHKQAGRHTRSGKEVEEQCGGAAMCNSKMSKVSRCCGPAR
jgi:hypothetical protein